MIIFELHNMFNMLQERSIGELERLIKNTKDEQKKELFSLILSFDKNYGWSASYSLVRLLEREI